MKKKMRMIKLCIKYTICVRGLMKRKTRIIKLCIKNTCERIDEKKDEDD